VKKSGITAVIICKNEVSLIEDCIRSVAPVCDEVLVLDSQSTDGTPEKAVSLGAKVLSVQWLGYGATKNFGADTAQHPWILSIDADERLSPELQLEISKLDLSNPGVFAFNRLNYFCGQAIRYSGWFPEWRPRLYHRDVASWSSDAVHEVLELGSGMSVQRLSGLFHHFSYQEAGQLGFKSKKYALLKAMEWRNQGKFPSVIRLLVSPIWRFLKTYVLRRGFLDGVAGFKIAWWFAVSINYQYYFFLRLHFSKDNQPIEKDYGVKLTQID